MCVVSYISDYGSTLPLDQWTRVTWTEYQELLRKAAEFDKIANQPDCVDPAKEAWMKKVEARLKKLEVKSRKAEK